MPVLELQAPSATPDGGPARRATAPRGQYRVSLAVLTRFTRNLELQLDAGVPLLRALRSQQSGEQDRDLADCVSGVIGLVEGGASLSQALDVYPGVFGPVYRNMVRAGEASGQVDRILGELSAYLIWVQHIRKTISKALRYPAIILCATFLLVMFIVGWVVPKFAPMFEKLGDNIPFTTQMLLEAGTVVSEHWILIGVALVGGGLCLTLFKRTRAGRRSMLRALSALPLFGSVLRAIDMARLTRNLSILSGAGIPLVQALELSKDSVMSPDIEQSLQRTCDSLVQGDPFTQAMEATGRFEPTVVNMISVGEEAGRLPDVFSRLAEHFDEDARDRVSKAMQTLEPMITLGLGFLIGGIAASILTTLYKVMMVTGR